MMHHNLEIQKLLLKVESSVDSPYQLQLLQSAIQIADRHRDILWGFELRLRLINIEALTPSCKLSFPAFSWILDMQAQNSEILIESDLLFEYKWMFACSFGNTCISKESIHQIAEDFLQRLVRNGYSARGYYQIMGIWYQHLRQFDKAQQVIDKLDELMIDPLGDHPAFELTLRAYNLLKLGQIDKAILIANKLFINAFQDIHTSFDSYSVFAFELYILKDSRARDFYELAFENQQNYNENDSITDVRSRILFMFLQYAYGDESCWSCFEKMCIYEHNAEDFYSYFFLKHAVCMLKNETGVKQFNFPSHLLYYKESGKYSLRELYEIFSKRAYAYAQQFDLRNGNSFMVEELDFLLALE
ncbi:hypothetical protein [Myroides sp. LJL119]